VSRPATWPDGPALNGAAPRLSQMQFIAPPDGAVIVLVGSFAPPHRSHVAVAEAAARLLSARDERVGAAVFVPNRDSYVGVKVGDRHGRLRLQKRVDLLRRVLSQSALPVIIDDVSATTGDNLTITDASVHSLKSHLGVDPGDVWIVVGSDQVASLRPHLRDHRAVCVLRPGAATPLFDVVGKKWFRRAVADGRLLLTERERADGDISSTAIRQELARILHDGSSPHE
jgi:nicotinic acid mononucleotide adenylyltransferase